SCPTLSSGPLPRYRGRGPDDNVGQLNMLRIDLDYNRINNALLMVVSILRNRNDRLFGKSRLALTRDLRWSALGLDRWQVFGDVVVGQRLLFCRSVDGGGPGQQHQRRKYINESDNPKVIDKGSHKWPFGKIAPHKNVMPE